MLLINRQYLFIVSHDEIKKIDQFVRVRDINSRKHDNFKYVKLNFYIQKKKVDDTTITTHFKRKVHIINEFKIELFIEINIMNSKIISIDSTNKRMTIKNCDIVASFNVTSKKKRVNRIMRIIVFIIISFFTTMSISMKFRERVISIDKNYSFHFTSNVRFDFDDDFYAAIVDVNIVVVQIRNVTN